MHVSRRWTVMLSLLVASNQVVGCVKLPDTGSGEDSTSVSPVDDLEDLADDLTDDLEDVLPSEEEAHEILAELFPNLDAEEIVEVEASLSIDEIIALQVELEAAREAVERESAELEEQVSDAVSVRDADGLPTGLNALGTLCRYSEGNAEIVLSGVFSGETAVQLKAGAVSVLVDGEVQAGTFKCLTQDESVDIVFLIDITGSMASVIGAVRDSVVEFVSAIEAKGVRGSVGVVTFQDSVGVDVRFQEPAPANDFERSPFYAPVPLDDATRVEDLRGFVRRLEANMGNDGPENLSGAIDFARNNTIGGSATDPNVIDGDDDPRETRPFPELTNDRQIFVVLTDAPFHSDSRDQTNSSLLEPFVPRDAEVIAKTLQQTGTIVHVIDVSWFDSEVADPSDPSVSAVDADYWARKTGGLGEPTEDAYSIVDLELVAWLGSEGLLSARLNDIIATTCSFEFEASLSAESSVEVRLEVGEETFERALEFVEY